MVASQKYRHVRERGHSLADQAEVPRLVHYSDITEVSNLNSRESRPVLTEGSLMRGPEPDAFRAQGCAFARRGGTVIGNSDN